MTILRLQIQLVDLLESAILSRVAALKGGSFSSACSAMPSSRSPSDKSRYSARPLRTFSRRFFQPHAGLDAFDHADGRLLWD